ncbi:PAS domain S-box protein [uncultured Methanoregula sp.]|uniref:PAS domain S-box protein n=1 Tax=uncultured Methanoregula sp. TaxID=1005933 RepID=UPI002AAB9A04|nr:PAS domain S-box protein [uncultured Methanoregula sp.]
MMQDYQHELSQIRELLKKKPEGMSVTDLSKALGKNKNTVGRYLDILLISGQVDMRTYGMAKVFSLSQRVPLSALISYSNELIMVLDAESRIVQINDHFLRLLHLTRNETIGKNLTYLSPPDVDVHELLETISEESLGKEHTLSFRVRDMGERIFKQKSIPAVFEDGGKGRTIILEDVTEHILAERQIRESEERFRMMAENIQDGLIIMENDKNVYANRRIAEITGYTFEESFGLEPLAIIAPECHDIMKEQIAELEKNPEKPGEIQVWIIRKDGERRFVSARISSVRYQDTDYNFVIFTDMTESKRQEILLRESEQRFRMMAENIQDGLIIVENGNFIYANRRVSEISGYSNEDLIRMKSMDLVAPDDLEKLERFILDTQPESRGRGELTFWINRKDGTRRCILGRVTAAKQGSTISTYVTMTDVTESAEREKALRDRITALQQLIS